MRIELGSKIGAILALKGVNNNGRDKIIEPCQNADGSKCENYDGKALCSQELIQIEGKAHCPLQRGVISVVSVG